MDCYSDAPYHSTRHLKSGPVFKWWSEYRSVDQLVNWIPNYRGTGHQNSQPFDERRNLHDVKTKLACYSDPQSINRTKILQIIYLDRGSNKEASTHSFPEDWQKPLVYLLYRPGNKMPNFMYNGDLNTNHLNTKLFEVWISNDLFCVICCMYFDLPFKYQTCT